MNQITLKIKSLSDQPLPYYATPGASGLDLFAAQTAYIEPGLWDVVPTGIQIELPEGYEGQIRPRSSTMLRYGLLVMFGTIDQDFRDELGVVVVNLSGRPAQVNRGDKLAQLVVCKLERVKVVEVAAVAQTDRGGFGSTG